MLQNFDVFTDIPRFYFQSATALLWIFTRSVECCLSRISDEPPIKPLIHQLLWRVFFQMVTVCWIHLVWWICWKPCSAVSDYCCSAEPRTAALAMLPWWWQRVTCRCNERLESPGQMEEVISKTVPAEMTRLKHESWISMLVLTSFIFAGPTQPEFCPVILYEADKPAWSFWKRWLSKTWCKPGNIRNLPAYNGYYSANIV